MHARRVVRPIRFAAVGLAAAALLVPSATRAEPASGTVSLSSRAGPVAFGVANVYLVAGPDAGSGKTIRQLIFTSEDIGAKLLACASMSCASGIVVEGMTVDFDAGPRLNYWVVGNRQKVQYSGTAVPAQVSRLTVDTPQRLAGTLTIDDTSAGGAKANVTFDATVVKQFAR